jgi:hypothetical protein
VYPYRPAALDSLLTGRSDTSVLRSAGALAFDPGAENLMALVEELDAALVIDGQSVWRLARRVAPAINDDSEGPRTAWNELDFTALRRHPKLAQYRRQGQHPIGPDPTDLQVVLSAIAEHFRGYGDNPWSDATARPGTDLDSDLVDEPLGVEPPSDKSVEELEQEAAVEATEEQVRRRVSIEARNRAAWRSFCDRFIRGLGDADFLDLVGPTVAISNAIIFNHLLAALVSSAVLDHERGLRQQVELWRFLWGDGHANGYLDTLDQDEQLAALDAMADRRTDLVVMTSVAYADQLARANAWDELHADLRDVWRRMLTSPLVGVSTLADISLASGLRNSASVATRLDELANHWTSSEVCKAVAQALGTTSNHVRQAEATVVHRGRPAKVSLLAVEDPLANLDDQHVTAAFAAWAVRDRRRTYLRIDQSAAKRVAVWDRMSGECWSIDRMAQATEVPLPPPVVTVPEWSVRSGALLSAVHANSAA